ncbi:MAG: hypothetical protein AB7U75_10125 [Hyphomicrobiaceae bacterium]
MQRCRRQADSASAVRRPAAAEAANRIRFTPAILPPYARHSKSLDVPIPLLYLKRISTSVFEEELSCGLIARSLPASFSTAQ